MWDVRQGGRPALQLQQPAPVSAAPSVSPLPAAAITCLDVHPAQHFACATGDAAGCVAVWDLRAASSAAPGDQLAAAAAAPAVACTSVTGGSGAAVCDLRFEGSSSIGSGSQRAVYCTSGGAIGLLRDAGGAGGGGRLLFQEPTAAVRACCVGGGGPCPQLFCATDAEGLVYMANATAA